MTDARDQLSYHEQMLDAQAGCVPCKLCGGAAVISDAGCGAGYHIRCGNSLQFRESRGCMITDRRLGGWAYNVMDWWNRLHAQPATSPADPVQMFRLGAIWAVAFRAAQGRDPHFEEATRAANDALGRPA